MASSPTGRKPPAAKEPPAETAVAAAERAVQAALEREQAAIAAEAKAVAERAAARQAVDAAQASLRAERAAAEARDRSAKTGAASEPSKKFRVIRAGSYSDRGQMITLPIGRVIDANVHGWDAIERMRKLGIGLEPIL